MYKARIWLVVDLANEHNIRPEILRGRFKACKETAIYEGIEIPVVTDFELRAVQSFGAGSLGVNTLNKKWLSKPLMARDPLWAVFFALISLTFWMLGKQWMAVYERGD